MSYADAVPLNIPPFNFENSPLWTSAFLFTPNFCDCSYHGRCVPINDSTGTSRIVCECDEGWTGLSDFMDGRGASCHVNEEAIRYLWVANIALWFIVIAISMPKIIHLLGKHYVNEEKMRAKGKSFRIWNNQGLFSVVVGLFICVPGMVMVGVLRIAFPNSRIALDYVITLFWFIGRLGMGASTSLHQPSLMKQMLRAQSIADTVVRNYDRYGKIIAVSQTIACFWALPVLVTRGEDVVLTRVCFALFCAQVGFGFLLLFMQSMAIQSVLHKILTEGAKTSGQPNLLTIRDKLCEGQNMIKKQTFVQTLIYVVYAMAPPLWLSYDYMLPLSWLTPPLILVNVVNTLYDEKVGLTNKNNRPKAARSERKSFEVEVSTMMIKRDIRDDPTQYTSFVGAPAFM